MAISKPATPLAMLAMLAACTGCNLSHGDPVAKISEQERVVLGADIDLSDTAGQDIGDEDFQTLSQDGRVIINRMVFRDTRLADARGREWTETDLISSEPIGPAGSKETFEAARHAQGVADSVK